MFRSWYFVSLAPIEEGNLLIEFHKVIRLEVVGDDLEYFLEPFPFGFFLLVHDDAVEEGRVDDRDERQETDWRLEEEDREADAWNPEVVVVADDILEMKVGGVMGSGVGDDVHVPAGNEAEALVRFGYRDDAVDDDGPLDASIGHDIVELDVLFLLVTSKSDEVVSGELVVEVVLQEVIVRRMLAAHGIGADDESPDVSDQRVVGRH